MNHNKSLLLVVAEWWESRKAHQLSIGGKSSGFWRWFLPTPGNVIFTLLVIGSLLWAQSVGAVSLGAPSVNSSLTIPYQGRLANASGTPFTGNQNMEFRLYNAPSGGTPLWSELWTGGNSVTVNDGLFSVLLGSLTAGLPAVVQGNGQLWLGITVGTDSEMSPRVQLGSAAYSMQALTVPDGSITKTKLGSDIAKITLLPVPGMVLYKGGNPATPVFAYGTEVWQSLSLSTIIPSSAKAILLDIGVSSATNTGVRLSTRKPSTVYEYTPKVETLDTWNFGQGWVNVTNQMIEYTLTGSGSAYFYIQVVGYME